MSYERNEDPKYDGILDGEKCPCCGNPFCRADTIVYAVMDDEIRYFFHKDCLTEEKESFLEDLGYDIDERDGSCIDL